MFQLRYGSTTINRRVEIPSNATNGHAHVFIRFRIKEVLLHSEHLALTVTTEGEEESSITHRTSEKPRRGERFFG
jgi:hypothetical protein